MLPSCSKCWGHKWGCIEDDAKYISLWSRQLKRTWRDERSQHEQQAYHVPFSHQTSYQNSKYNFTFLFMANCKHTCELNFAVINLAPLTSWYEVDGVLMLGAQNIGLPQGFDQAVSYRTKQIVSFSRIQVTVRQQRKKKKEKKRKTTICFYLCFKRVDAEIKESTLLCTGHFSLNLFLDTTITKTW